MPAKKWFYESDNDVPHSKWDEIVVMIREKKTKQAGKAFDAICSSIRTLKSYEAAHLAIGIKQKADDPNYQPQTETQCSS